MRVFKKVMLILVAALLFLTGYATNSGLKGIAEKKRIAAKVIVGELMNPPDQLNRESFDGKMNRFIDMHRIKTGAQNIILYAQPHDVFSLFDTDTEQTDRVAIIFPTIDVGGEYRLEGSGRPVVFISRVNNSFGQRDGMGCGGRADWSDVEIRAVDATTYEVTVQATVSPKALMRSQLPCDQLEFRKTFLAAM